MEISGVKVFAHWFVFLIGAVILLGDLEEALLAVTVLAAYYGVILIHECGHMIAAQHKGYRVWSSCTPSGESPDLANPAAISIGASSLGVASWRRRSLR
jgi:hypothetical protein